MAIRTTKYNITVLINIIIKRYHTPKLSKFWQIKNANNIIIGRHVDSYTRL